MQNEESKTMQNDKDKAKKEVKDMLPECNMFGKICDDFTAKFHPDADEDKKELIKEAFFSGSAAMFSMLEMRLPKAPGHIGIIMKLLIRIEIQEWTKESRPGMEANKENDAEQALKKEANTTV